MNGVLVLLALASAAAALSVPTAPYTACKNAFTAEVTAAGSDADKCAALLTYARCLADLTQSLSQTEQLAADGLVAEAQAALGSVNCSDATLSKPGRISHEGGDIKLTVNEDSDFKFFRFRRESVSIWDLQAQYDAVVEEVRESLQKTLNANDVTLQRQAADSDGRVTGLRTAVDILIGDVSTRASQIVSAANVANIKADEVQAILNQAIAASENARLQKQNFDLQQMRDALAVDMSRALSTVQAKRNDIRARFDAGFNTLKSVIAANKQSVVNKKNALNAQVQAELTRFADAETNLNLKNVFPLRTDGTREDKPCNASEIGYTFLSRPGPREAEPVDPSGPEDNLNGQSLQMSSYGHGSGYSVALREIWNPNWDSNVVYRFDADSYAAKGSFMVGSNSIMQCAGDDRGYFYGAHWGQGVFCKYGPFPSMTSEKWCYSAGCTASGIAVNATHAHAACNSNNNIFIINRETGQLERNLMMQNWPGNGNYGIAMTGNRFWWLYPNQAYEYDLSGNYRRTFGLVTNPYAVFTDGEKFCFSPNSDTFYCYRVNKYNIYGGGTTLYWCDGEKNVPL